MSDPKETPRRFIMLKVGDRSAFLVGQLLEETDSEVVLYFPVVMTMGLDDHDELELNASKWMPFSKDDTVQIPKESLVAVAAPAEHLIDFYLKFLEDCPELRNGSLESKVLARSSVRGASPAAESEYIVSSAVH